MCSQGSAEKWDLKRGIAGHQSGIGTDKSIIG